MIPRYPERKCTKCVHKIADIPIPILFVRLAGQKSSCHQAVHHLGFSYTGYTATFLLHLCINSNCMSWPTGCCRSGKLHTNGRDNRRPTSAPGCLTLDHESHGACRPAVYWTTPYKYRDSATTMLVYNFPHRFGTATFTDHRRDFRSSTPGPLSYISEPKICRYAG